MPHPTRIAQIRNLDGDDVDLVVRLVHFLGLHVRRLSEIHVGHVVGEHLAKTAHQSQQLQMVAGGLNLRCLLLLLLRVGRLRATRTHAVAAGRARLDA